MLMKVTKLTDIVTSAIAVLETSVSKALHNGEIDEGEFDMLQVLRIKVINELSNVNHKMELEARNQLQKVVGRDKQGKENLKYQRRLMICLLFTVCYLVCYQNG